MSIGLDITGAGEFLRLKIDAGKLDASIRSEIRKLAKSAKADLIAALSRPGTGRRYGAKGTRRKTFFGKARNLPTYTASSPGQPPARASGNLLASIRTKYPRREKGYGVKVFAPRGAVFYRHFLEFGAGPAKRGKRKGAGGIRAPRPVFSPIQARLDGQLEAAILRAVNNFGGA